MDLVVAFIGAYVALEFYHIGRRVGHAEVPILVVRESLEDDEDDEEHEDHPASAPPSPSSALDLVSVSAPVSDEE